MVNLKESLQYLFKNEKQIIISFQGAESLTWLLFHLQPSLSSSNRKILIRFMIEKHIQKMGAFVQLFCGNKEYPYDYFGHLC